MYNSDINSKNYYGSILEDSFNEEDQKKFQQQREQRGFDDTELWNLDKTICRFALPRLKALKEMQNNDNIIRNGINEAIEALENYLSGSINETSDIKTLKKFFNNFDCLWI